MEVQPLAWAAWETQVRMQGEMPAVVVGAALDAVLDWARAAPEAARRTARARNCMVVFFVVGVGEAERAGVVGLQGRGGRGLGRAVGFLYAREEI